MWRIYDCLSECGAMHPQSNHRLWHAPQIPRVFLATLLRGSSITVAQAHQINFALQAIIWSSTAVHEKVDVQEHLLNSRPNAVLIVKRPSKA